MSFSSYILSKCFRVFTIVKSVWFRKRKKNFNRVSTLKLICHHLSMWHHFSVYHLHVSTNFYMSPLFVIKFLGHLYVSPNSYVSTNFCVSPLHVTKFLCFTSISPKFLWSPLCVTQFLHVTKFLCVTSTMTFLVTVSVCNYPIHIN